MTNPRIEVVLFDADGVLQSRASDSLIEALKRLLPDPDEGDAFVAEVFAVETPCLSGDGDFPQALAGVLEKWGSSVETDQALRIWRQIEVDHGVLGVVRQVRSAGYRVGLASNQWNGRAAYMSIDLGYGDLFDFLFYSCDIGAAKPDTRFFEAVVKRLQVEAETVLFLDDHPKNVESARAVGLRSELFAADAGADVLRNLLTRHDVVLQAP